MSKIIGRGAPTVNTMGAVGQEYFDKDSNITYTCVKVTHDNATTLTGEMREQCEWAPNGSGSVSWDDVQDNPFGKSEGWVDVLKNYTPVYEDYAYYITDIAIQSITAGERYLVACDGSDYECTAVGDVSWGDTTAVMLGNLQYYGGENTGEPFCIIVYPTQDGSNDYGRIEFQRDVGTAMITIRHKAEIVKQPLDWQASEGSPWYIKNRTHYGTEGAGETLLGADLTSSGSTTLPNTGAVMFSAGPVPLAIQVTAGEEVFVSLGGAQYKCVFVPDPAASYILTLGNLSYAYDMDDTGEPFLVILQPHPMGGYLVNVYTPQQLNAVPFAIAKVGVVVEKQLDPAYIPDDSCYLTSPNGTRYKVTVADDGTLSATAAT